MVHTFRRVLETAVHDGTKTLGLQDEVTETGAVDADIVTSVHSQKFPAAVMSRVAIDAKPQTETDRRRRG